MADRDQLYTALRNADAAGDVEGAKKLAAYIKSLPEDSAPKQDVQQTEQPSAWQKFNKWSMDAQDAIKQGSQNLVAGAVRGAGSIGATLLTPVDAAARALGVDPNGEVGAIVGRTDRRSSMDNGLQNMGADPNSLTYKTGKLGAEIAGTAGVGGALANGARAVGAAPTFVNALASGGLSAQGANMLTRVAGGAATGGASAGLVDPSEAGTGAVIGGAIPVVAKAGGIAGQYVADARAAAANKLMNSALKPTLAQKQSGDAAIAVQTLLDNGINPTKGGVNKLRDMVNGLNDEIASRVQNSNATISKQDVINALNNVKDKFSNQVSPTADLGAINSVADDFTNHPNIIGDAIPVQQAQQLKQGTYKVLSGKYGEAGSATTEAQKGLARGLKEGIANAVPGVGELNAQESKLLTTLDVTERRALMDLNKNPMGLAALAHNPLSWAAFMADKSALFKSLAARMVNPENGVVTPYIEQGKNLLLNGQTTSPLLRSGAVISGANRNIQQ